MHDNDDRNSVICDEAKKKARTGSTRESRPLWGFDVIENIITVMGKRITRDSRNNRPGQLNKNNIARFMAATVDVDIYNNFFLYIYNMFVCVDG